MGSRSSRWLDPEEVHVSVDQTRQHDSIAEVYHPGAAGGGLRSGNERLDPVVLDKDRPRLTQRSIRPVDHAGGFYHRC